MLPVVMIDGDTLVGWNAVRLAQMLKIAFDENLASPADQVASGRRVLVATLRAVSLIPDDSLTWITPRDAELRDLAHHIFAVVEAGVTADVLGRFHEFAFQAPGGWHPLTDHTTAARIVRYGEAVMHKFDSWFAVVDAPGFERTLPTDNGPRTFSQVMQRTVSHSAHHLRQLYDCLRLLDIEAASPIAFDETTIPGVHLPRAIW
jgi:hypothetical protein